MQVVEITSVDIHNQQVKLLFSKRLFSGGVVRWSIFFGKYLYSVYTYKDIDMCTIVTNILNFEYKVQNKPQFSMVSSNMEAQNNKNLLQILFLKH